jgi:eukaryotic-like serine/threonine-protein kinase
MKDPANRARLLLREFRRRHVYRVGALYLASLFVVLQAANLLTPAGLLGHGVYRLLTVIGVIGFPIALVLAWAFDITPDGVERTSSGGASAEPGSSRMRLLSRGHVAAGVAVLLVAALAAFAVIRRGAAELPRGEALHAELWRLVEGADYASAFELAERARRAGETVPDSLEARFTDRLTVLGEPEGASVHALRFEPGATPTVDRWIDLGTTPLRGAAVARGDYVVRIAAEGYATAERPVSSARVRWVLPLASAAELQVDVRLQRTSRVPAAMVHVPGGLYRVASRDLQALSAAIDDFLLDRFEVTNAQFAEFVDAGGYARSEHWPELAEGADRDVMARLVDRTGLAAPRTWSGQRPPADRLDHPVTGVTWYEAAAYCRYRGGQLPTLFQWEKAARDGHAATGEGFETPWGYVDARKQGVDRANFDGSDTRAVGSYIFGVSAYGAYDMAGNVKEWLQNRSENGRAVTGGSFADPVYLFSEVGSMDPAAASPMIGFRCARAASDAVVHGSGDVALRLTIETPVYRPVDEATFRLLRAHYNYDRRDLDARVEERLEAPAWTRERISWMGPHGQRVHGYLFLPNAGKPPYQTMVYVPNTAAFLGDNVGDQAEAMLGPLVRAGRALFTVVLDGMTDRPFPAGWQRPATNSVAFRDLMVRHATELRFGIDYLESRHEIDSGALAYVGSSWGAGSRLLFAAVDDRFRATVLIGAGIDERVHPTLPEASNINFAPFIRGPKLIVNGREDEEHPWLTRALPLWNLLSEPKQLALFEGVGHLPPPEMRIPAIRAFLDDVLK